MRDRDTQFAERRRSRSADKPFLVPRESILIFDGDCGFCTSTAEWAAHRFHHGEKSIAWQLLPDGVLENYSLTPMDVRQAAWWVSGSMRERGHRAIGQAMLAAGGLWTVLGWFILTAPFSWIAAAIYRVIVRWRYRMPGGTTACRVDERVRGN